MLTQSPRKRKAGDEPADSPPTRRPRLQIPSSTPPPSPAIISARLIQTCFDSWLAALPAAMIGTLGGTSSVLQMPMQRADGRMLTWRKFAAELVNKISATNTPATTNDCWFVLGGEKDTAGYPIKKLSPRGSANKWPLHRIMFFLSEPGLLNYASSPEHTVAHRCGRGRYNFAIGIEVSCVNPHHLTLTSLQVNLNHNLCRRSCAAWCPHDPRCVYTNENGQYLPCRNAIPLQYPCKCPKSCFPKREIIKDETTTKQHVRIQEVEDGYSLLGDSKYC
ncbi:hypothetical protein F4820DRAFT_450572 [Hypoxylon rubiginosum]|uniref:Uncharacterized protein n=1 Tax=Hypoxylon rubiginosum TaxID=110542 RepID=A0ACB9YTV9_9PEZI|nr:hypothetical protein F4820DRAFT_450572 [Hypoxylon rubiginosum]